MKNHTKLKPLAGNTSILIKIIKKTLQFRSSISISKKDSHERTIKGKRETESQRHTGALEGSVRYQGPEPRWKTRQENTVTGARSKK